MKQRIIKRGISFHLDIRAFYTSSFVRISVMDIIDLRKNKKKTQTKHLLFNDFITVCCIITV